MNAILLRLLASGTCAKMALLVIHKRTGDCLQCSLTEGNSGSCRLVHKLVLKIRLRHL